MEILFLSYKIEKHLHTLSMGIQSGTTLLKGNLTIPNTAAMHLPIALAVSP